MDCITSHGGTKFRRSQQKSDSSCGGLFALLRQFFALNRAGSERRYPILHTKHLLGVGDQLQYTSSTPSSNVIGYALSRYKHYAGAEKMQESV